MKYPILQVGFGRFKKNNPGLCLAILSTRLLSVHIIESTDKFSKITECQVHRLERNAYNFVSGQFGNESNKNDQICVQSIDGALYFFNDDDVLFKI